MVPGSDSRGLVAPISLRALFTTPEFNAPATRAAKFKRPFHYVVSALRATNARTDARAHSGTDPGSDTGAHASAYA